MVTAAHVYLGYLNDLESATESVEAQFCDVVFDPVAALIAIDEELDVATFRLTTGQIRMCGKSVLTGGQVMWPPPAPKVPQAVFVTGYPGADSIEFGPGNFSFAEYSAILKTHDVGPRNIGLHIDPGELDDYVGLGVPPPGYDMGGISGAPLLTLVEDQVLSWQLCGVIYESNPSLDLVLATRADYLNVDGTIG